MAPTSRLRTDASTAPHEPTEEQSTDAYLKEVEEKYNRRLDADVQVLLDSFNDIIRVASIQDKDKFRIAQESFQIELRAKNIVKAAESLLSLISDLKMALYLQDTKTLTDINVKKKEIIDEEKSAVIEELKASWNNQFKT